jgi:hypothetical protein
MFDSRRFIVLVQFNRYEIDAPVGLQFILLAKIGISGFYQVLLLGFCYRFLWRTEAAACFGAHFRKNKATVFLGDDVYFSGGAAVIGLDYAIAFILEVCCGERFSQPADIFAG